MPGLRDTRIKLNIVGFRIGEFPEKPKIQEDNDEASGTILEELMTF